MMRVLIYEPQFLGHNLGHVSLLVKELATLPCEVVVATSRQAVGSKEFAVQLGQLPAEVELTVLDGFQLDKHQRRVRTSGIGGATASYRGLCHAIDRTRPDHVLVPYGNTLARIACLPAGLPRRLRRTGAEIETLLVGGRFMFDGDAWSLRLRQRLCYQMLARGPWTSLFHLDIAAVEAIHTSGPSLRRTVKLMPDPIMLLARQTKLAARQLLGIATDGRYVVVTGLIEARKGIGPLIGALKELPNDCRLLLAGKCDPPTRALLQAQYGDLIRSGRLIALDRYLSREEFAAALFAADVISAVYPNHRHSSSIVVASAAAQRPVVGAAFGWIGRVIEDFNLGATCVPDQMGSLAKALRSSLQVADGFRLTERGERFAAFNSSTNFGATWTARLRERLGLHLSQERLEWNWVTAPTAAAA